MERFADIEKQQLAIDASSVTMESESLMGTQNTRRTIYNTARCRVHTSKMALILCLLITIGIGLAQGQTSSRYECQTTPNGIPCKVIVKAENAQAYANEDFSGPGRTLRFFRKYFVFKQSEEGYQIGEATSSPSILGWVRKENVIPWNIEQAIYFINKEKEGRIPVRIWQNKEDIDDMSKPYFEELLNVACTTEPFPILQVDGPYVQVAFLWDIDESVPALGKDMSRVEHTKRKPEGKDLPRGKERLQEIIQATRRMDVVLVMNVTGSMKPCIDRVRLNIVHIVDNLWKMVPEGPEVDIYIGIVAYKDYADTETVRICNLTKDCEKVVRFLEGLTVGGGGGNNEAVCEALYQGIRTMNWGAHSSRIMCLVGDAPPHTTDDSDTKNLVAAGTFVQSDFFNQPFEKNVKIVRRFVDDKLIQLYVFGIGKDATMQERFRSFVNSREMPEKDSEERFFALADSEEFIQALSQQLQKSRTEHQGRMQIVEKKSRGASLDAYEREQLRLLNIDDPEKLAEMYEERIQTGWFKPDEGETCAFCVYIRCRELEEWQRDLMFQLRDYEEKQEEILEGILKRHAGSGLVINSINDAYKVARDLAYQPDILRLENLGMEDATKVRKLRRKLNNIMVLLYTDKLFNSYGEGWIPIAYLPGDFTE